MCGYHNTAVTAAGWRDHVVIGWKNCSRTWWVESRPTTRKSKSAARGRRNMQKNGVKSYSVSMFALIRCCIIMPPPLIGGAIKRCFCLTSVCLSVAYIGPKSRTERPRKTIIGTEIVHVTRDSDTTFKVKRSKVKVTRPLYSARP